MNSMKDKVKTSINNYKYIYISIIIIIIKLVLMLFFSSDYQDKLFIPFINQFISMIVKGKGIDVYQYFYQSQMENSFPYPPLMLYIESIFGGAIYFFDIDSKILCNLIFKMPILIFDLLGVYILNKLYPNKQKYICLIYFASPIILYAGYMHGQLDIIPTNLLMFSILYAVMERKEKNLIISAFFMGLALSTKLHIIAVFPFVLALVYKKYGIKAVIKYIIIVFMVNMFFLLPFMSKGYLENVIITREQSYLTSLYIDYHQELVYVPILAVCIIYLRAMNLSSMNSTVLLYFCGITFGVLLTMTPVMPGWYIWVVPFITIYFIDAKEERILSIWNYFLLNFIYLIYFIFLHSRKLVDLYFINFSLSFFKIENELIKNLFFTALSGCMLYFVFLLYRNGLKVNPYYRKKSQFFTIGIAGDSGVGKSSYLSMLSKSLGNDNITYIEGDGDHRWERNSEKWKLTTSLNPKSNYLYKQVEDIRNLKNGNRVKRVDYNHDTGKFTEEYIMKPNKYVVVCGLHGLYLPQLRKNLDLKVYLDTDETLRRYWKIQRDVNQRGYSLEKVLKQIEDRLTDAKKYVYPQRKYADLIVKYFDNELTDCLIQSYQPNIDLELMIISEIDTEGVIVELSNAGVEINYEFSNDLKWQKIVVRGKNLKSLNINFKKIAKNHIWNLDDITYEEIYISDSMIAIIQLFTLLIISYKMGNT